MHPRTFFFQNHTIRCFLSLSLPSAPNPTDLLQLLLLQCHLYDLSLKQLEPFGPLLSHESGTVIHQGDRYQLQLSSHTEHEEPRPKQSYAHLLPTATSLSRNTMTIP